MTRCTDAAVRSIPLFGGQTGACPNTTLPADTWEWDGTSWQQSSSSAPTGTTLVRVAYDDRTSALYLFWLTGTVFATHRWNGTALTVAAAATPPYVPEWRQLVALGSNPGGVLFYVRTCDLTGEDRSPDVALGGCGVDARDGDATVYPTQCGDGVRPRLNRVVLCGGEVATATPDLADTWEFDGTTWARR